jgi:sugar lactone lactonase YvrE
LDKSSRLLYAVDSGHRRVVRLDIDSGTENGDVPTNDPIVKHARMDGAALEEFVPPGTLERPSGIALGGGIAFVSDNATNRIYAFDAAGKLLRSVDVELPEQSVGGITLGPDQRLYLAGLKSGAGYRLNAAE